MDFLGWLIAVIALVLAIKSRGKLGELREDVRLLKEESKRLYDRLEALGRELQALRRQATVAETPMAKRGPSPELKPEPRPAPPAAAPAPAPAPAAPPVSAAPAPPRVAPPPAPAAAPPKPPPSLTAPPAAPPPRPPSPPRAATPPTPPAPPAARFDWESLIGVKLFSWIAGIALVLAAIFFLKYSVEHGWLSAPVRMAIGLATGIALLVTCELRAARRYPVTANAMDAAGIAILFSTFFAAHALWHLVGAFPTFALMAVVTAVAVLLSIRRESVFIALLGLVGGFATPALLSTGEDRPIGLFSYLLLLNAGLAWVGYKKRWPHLTILSAIFTTLYQWGWVMKFLRTGNLPLAMGIFLVFPILSFAALALGQKREEEDKWSPLFGHTSAVSVSLPLLFAVYMAAIPAYAERYGLLFGFLFLVALGLAAIAASRGPEVLHAAGGLSTLLVFCIWLAVGYKNAAWPAVVGIVAGFILFYLAVPVVLRRMERSFSGLGAIGVYAAPLLLVTFPILAGIEPAAASPGLLFGVLFVLMSALALYAVFMEEGAVHFLAAFFALGAEAVWSGRNLTPERLLPALSIYALFALFYLGVPIAARRLGKALRPAGSGAILLFVSLGLLFFLAAGSVATAALWGLALLLVIINAGLFLEAASGHHPILSLLGILLSWIVLAVWWATAAVAAFLVPALVIVAGFGLVILGGNIWAEKRLETQAVKGGPAGFFGQGLFLALVGHFFLLFVASQKTLSVPPWPLLGVLAVLDLAIGVAALYTRRGQLHIAALAASQFILMVWQGVAGVAPWPRTAIFCAGAVALVGLVWFLLSRRLGVPGEEPGGHLFAIAAVAAIFLGQGVAIHATLLSGSPGATLLAYAHVAFLLALLAMAWWTEWHALAAFAVLPTALGVLAWREMHFKPEFWGTELYFAGAIYVVFLAYPMVLDWRGQPFLEPYLAAVLAGVPFFFWGRHSMLQGGFGDRIGLLPVAQAGCMAVLLWRLLRLEPPGERTLGRLAMVAGATLAFVTVAIPLQLEKQWITIGWALEGAALAWLYRRIPHKGLLAWTAGLLLGVFVRLVFNPAVFEYHPRGAAPIWNWYLYTYLVSAAAFFAAARFLRDRDDKLLPALMRLSALATAGGTVLLFLLLNIEIADYYSTGPTLTFKFSAGLAQDLTYTIGWALFAMAMLTAGIVARSRAARISAIVLLVLTVLKCFLHDLWQLGGLYRVGSFVGLAICLALVALALQKFVLRPQREAS